ncbi:MAG: recombinase family protein [Clostridiales bacterium]|jgi:DNA invertase Pin-like site-specific DNA recombinase|nr:recombinase family protein [Clostridiales bacterium]
MVKQQANAAAIYCRLSRDDGNDAESNSIGTQRTMLQRYAKEHGFAVYDEYVDDGWSGTQFDRPDFKRMLSDIENGRIGIVLCKDLSRCGRNNALVAYYTEIVFPDNDVRFVAVNDAIDTAMGDSGGNAVMPFMSVVNEYYARDISKKVRSARRTRALNGEHCAGRTPLGYLKDPNDKHKLVIDEETADIVRSIFQMAADGLGNYQICYRLAQNKVKSPSAWEYERTGKFGKYYDPDYPWSWFSKTVVSILHNQMYLGHMRSHTQTTKSFKNHKIVAVPKEDWIIVENTHEPIVSQELFDKVQSITKIKKRANTANVENVFQGLAYCADCNAKLTLQTSSGGGHVIYLMCHRYRHGTRSGGNRLCTSHTTRFEDLKALTMTLIRSAVAATLDVEGFVKAMTEEENQNDSSKRTLDRLKRRDGELKILIKRVFEQNALGKIDDGTFADLYNSYQSEQNDISAKIRDSEEKAALCKDKGANARLFAEAVSKYTDAEVLTREMVLDLVEKVVVHEPVGTRGPKRHQKVDIYFRFIGQLPEKFLQK